MTLLILMLTLLMLIMLILMLEAKVSPIPIAGKIYFLIVFLPTLLMSVLMLINFCSFRES